MDMNRKQAQGTSNSIVILYTELAGYTVTCIEALSRIYQVHVHIINYPTNSDAPFSFDNTNELITYYNRKGHNKDSINELIKNTNPFLIYCAGWGDKEYLAVIRENGKKIPALLGFDNKWNGSLKQGLSAIYARLRITPYFNYAFVPGEQQKIFAQKLGFKKEAIIEGAYSADVDFFNRLYSSTKETKQGKMPHRFIFVGRYVKEKGIEELWEAFIAIQNSKPNDWELWCLGVGKIPPVDHPKIKHFGFIQPSALAGYITQTSVFILPSKFEPWGVVVHEFAAAGFPLLLSTEVGAAGQFLTSSNGFAFEPTSVSTIQTAMEKMIAKSDEEIFQMGQASQQLAQTITPETWAKSLFQLKK